MVVDRPLRPATARVAVAAASLEVRDVLGREFGDRRRQGRGTEDLTAGSVDLHRRSSAIASIFVCASSLRRT
jgi:hypothetical protein